MFECDLNGMNTCITQDFYTNIGTVECSLSDYFNDHPVLFKTYDDSVISGFEIYKGVSEPLAFDQAKITGVDWKAHGTDTGVEFTDNQTNGTVSIQDTLQTILQSDPSNKYILFDHGSGEIADYIGIQENEDRLIVRFYHVKRKSAAGLNSSLEDIYEVAGQAVKSLTWLMTKGKLVSKITDRHSSGHCKLLNGDYKEFIKNLRGSSKQLTAYVVIVQPSLSRSAPMPDKIQEVLAAADTYVSRAGKVKGLEIMGSM